MAALIQHLAPRGRGAYQINSLDDWVGLWGLDGLQGMLQTTMGKTVETTDGTFSGLVYGAYLRNSIVFSCLAVRARLFGEPRFQFQQLRRGRPGALYGTSDLGILEHPEPGKTTRDLLQMKILDADLGGNAFTLKRPDRMRRLRPDWVTIAYGSKNKESDLGAWDPDAEVIGYGYYPGGMSSGEKVQVFLPEEIGHFAPTKDPLARNRGISLLTAGLREVMADNAATSHKLTFFNSAATPNLALKFPPTMNAQKAKEWIDLFEQDHKGGANGWKTVYLGSGVEPVAVGLNFKDMDYAALQGRAETRIAALTGMHPVVVALSEGMQGSSLNAGNFAQAAREVGDATLRPLWGDIASSLENIVPAPPGSRLWYDDRDVAFLREDVKDQAEIVKNNAATIGQLVKDGFTPESAVAAVIAGDMNLLEHSGAQSVQLVPGSAGPAPQSAAMYRAKDDFWAVHEPFARLGTVEKGQVLAGTDDMVVNFPSMFEKLGDSLADRINAFIAQGKTVPEIATLVDRHERTVRRVLAGAPA